MNITDATIYLRNVKFFSTTEDKDIISTGDENIFECDGIANVASVKEKVCRYCLCRMFTFIARRARDQCTWSTWYFQNGQEIFS